MVLQRFAMETLDPGSGQTDDGVVSVAFSDEGARQAQAEDVRLQRGAIGNPGAHGSLAGQPGPVVDQELRVRMKHRSGLWPQRRKARACKATGQKATEMKCFCGSDGG